MIKRLEKEGKIKKQKAGIVQIETLLKQAILDLEEAKKISNIAERATYILAYMAMFKAGRALLLLKGYVPNDGSQHKAVVEMTSVILGIEYQELTSQFEHMRRIRNNMTYDAKVLVTLFDAKNVFSDAISLVQKILKEAKSQNPQLELDFDL